MISTERASFRDSRLLTYSFYVFMITCGFVAGTRVWSLYRQELDSLFVAESGCMFRESFMSMFIPAAVVFGAAAILAYFAGGWLLIPVCAYASGGALGILCCKVFSSEFGFAETAECIFYYLAIIAASFEFVGSHYMSRQLSGSGCQRVITYSQHMMGTAALLAAVAAICAATSGLIYFVVYR